MGNALTKEDITWQLEQMRAQGIGGVEQITMEEVYEKGNVRYLSDEYFELLSHAVAEAKRLDMEVSLNFGGPGWVWGGDWIPPSECNQTLLSSSFVVEGPARVARALSTEAILNPRDVPRSCRVIKPEDRLIAVVAGRELEGALVPESLVEITNEISGRYVSWEAPAGRWRVMAFWATVPDDTPTVNHIDKQAMHHYVGYLGAKYAHAVGEAFGETIDSFFGDSFEVPIHRNGIYWSDSLPAAFESRKNYPLMTHLPALWWDVGKLSPKVRYDVNHVLHEMGMEAFFDTFHAWCVDHGVKSRVQPYGFVTDNIEGAGAVHLPEMEITAGEKDAVPWFDTRIGPKKYVASGAHLYGRNVVTTEAYTYLHWEPYRATLEELKIASDNFLRAGANRFYNHGYIASPERDIAPTRGFYAAIHISHDNVWWRYYHLLAEYIARCCYLLRQGSFHADVAVYSPLANQWAQDAFNARRWTRDFDWGGLGDLIISNGYDFDLVNDEALQRMSTIDGPILEIGNMRYSVLILPNIQAMPLESLQRIERYVNEGGVVIALERVPEASCGMSNFMEEDATVRGISGRLFTPPVGRDGNGARSVGRGRTYWLNGVMDRSDVLDVRSSALDPFLNVLRSIIAPDMAIDFVRYDLRRNDGLAFIHRKLPDSDIYFVTNLQDRPVDMNVTFRVHDASPSEWDAYTGKRIQLDVYEAAKDGTRMPVRLAPYASTFFIFERGVTRDHFTWTGFDAIYTTMDGQRIAETRRAGPHGLVRWPPHGDSPGGGVVMSSVPTPLLLQGLWQVKLLGMTREFSLVQLKSWTDIEGYEHFSGTGRYTAEWSMAPEYFAPDIALRLSLGDVGGIAEVTVNGHDAGVVWMRGQELDITSLVKETSNRITIDVTNTLINRVAGLEAFPPVPDELQPRLGNGLHDADSPAKRLRGFEPLPRSGLLGPVEIRPVKIFRKL